MTLRPLRLAACLSLLAAPAFACLHMPADFAGSVEQSAQGGIVIWNDGHEELILKNDFVIRAESGAAMPSSLAWVIPVPNEPTRYGVESPDLFESMFNLWEAEAERWRDRTGKVVHEEVSKGWGARNSPADSVDTDSVEGIELLEKHQVGAYEIQPIRTTGPESGPALNAWLTESGFSEVPAANMAYYVERDWVWLAVKVNAAKNESSLSATGQLEPLRISFPSEQIVYPLKFSSHQGTFDVALWVITAEPLEGFEQHGQRTSTHPGEWGPKNPLTDYRFYGEGRWLPLPSEVAETQATAATEGSYAPLENAMGTKVPHVTKLWATVDGAKTTAWRQDFALKTR